jgi:hypothetical protein
VIRQRTGPALRSLVGVLLVSLVGCGDTGTTSSAGAPTASYGIDTVAWPSDSSSIRELLAQLPAESGSGRRSQVMQLGTPYGGLSFHVAYYRGRDSSPQTQVIAGQGSPDMNDATELYGLWSALGPKCVDLQGSDELLTAISAVPSPSGPLASMTALQGVPNDRFVWFACTSTFGTMRPFRPDEYRYVVAWSDSSEYFWIVEAGSDRERQQIVEALVAAATTGSASVGAA